MEEFLYYLWQYKLFSFRKLQTSTGKNIQILKYKDTQHYGWHHDEGPNPKSNEYFRRISVVTYLQNAEEGGRTIFPHRAYKPKAGQSLIFPSNSTMWEEFELSEILAALNLFWYSSSVYVENLLCPSLKSDYLEFTSFMYLSVFKNCWSLNSYSAWVEYEIPYFVRCP